MELNENEDSVNSSDDDNLFIYKMAFINVGKTTTVSGRIMKPLSKHGS